MFLLLFLSFLFSKLVSVTVLVISVLVLISDVSFDKVCIEVSTVSAAEGIVVIDFETASVIVGIEDWSILILLFCE